MKWITWLADWCVEWLADWVLTRLIYGLYDSMTGWLTDCRFYWLALLTRLISGLTDWLTDCWPADRARWIMRKAWPAWTSFRRHTPWWLEPRMGSWDCGTWTLAIPSTLCLVWGLYTCYPINTLLGRGSGHLLSHQHFVWYGVCILAIPSTLC